jgi:hypothetical protein
MRRLRFRLREAFRYIANHVTVAERSTFMPPRLDEI